jgi:glycosyltransferase involved in cell wall biosynthesis
VRIALIPAKDEEKTLSDVIEDVGTRVDSCLVVDDGSEDRTGEIAHDFGCVVVRNDQPTGYGAALRKGLTWCVSAKVSSVVTIDADGQHEAEWIDRAAPLLGGRADVIFANRFGSNDGLPETKVLSNNFAWDCVRRWIGRPPISEDVSCGLRMYSPLGMRKALETPVSRTSGYAFSQASYAFLHQSGLRLAALDTPAIYKEPVYGTSVGELRDFLEWLVECTSLQDEGLHWLNRLNQKLALTFEIEGWRSSGKQRVIAELERGEFLRFAPSPANHERHSFVEGV